MSVKIMGRVWDLDLPPAHKYVLLAMTDHADHNGENMYPGTGLIAHKTGYSMRQVQRIIDDLVQRGILEETIEPGRRSVFRADFTDVPSLPKYDARRKRAPRGDKMTPPRGDKMTPPRGDKMTPPGVTFATEGGDICDTWGVTSVQADEPPFSASEPPEPPQDTRTNRHGNHHENRHDLPPPTPYSTTTEGGGGHSLESFLLAAGFYPKVARTLAKRFTRLGLDLATVRADFERLRAGGAEQGAIVEYWRVHPPTKELEDNGNRRRIPTPARRGLATGHSPPDGGAGSLPGAVAGVDPADGDDADQSERLSDAERAAAYAEGWERVKRKQANLH